jgi:hypothetical protein
MKIFVTIHSKEIEVLCFDTLLQVFILDELGGCRGYGRWAPDCA